MKTLRVVLAIAVLTVFSAPAFAVDLKSDSFQVTGTIEKIDDSTITVMKGKERFHITKDAATKVTGELKAGAKVTVHYKMYAVDIEAKSDAKGSKK
ncbi:MAG: hypothetical protein ACHQPI_13025 [Thermoanaerobaculia bacterium]